MATLPNVTQARLVDADALEGTHNALQTAPDRLHEAAQRLAKVRAQIIDLKSLALPEAKQGLDLATNAATMDAYAAGLITGKNQAERDVQLNAHLAKSEPVAKAQTALRRIERQLAATEAEAEVLEADYKAAWARIAAARADAALQTAYLQLLAAPDSAVLEEAETTEFPNW